VTPAGPGASGFQDGDLRLVTVNLLGAVEHPALDGSPYRIDRDGRPYVPAGDGGIVLGLELGDSVFALDADHAAPGACLVHADPAARHALAAVRPSPGTWTCSCPRPVLTARATWPWATWSR
jgi:Domain of unknown function (DUF4438), N-terminal